jgi:hypothetical protein
MNFGVYQNQTQGLPNIYIEEVWSYVTLLLYTPYTSKYKAHQICHDLSKFDS